MTVAATSPAALLNTACGLTPLIRAHAEETERERRLAPAVVAALRAAGFYRLYTPVALGGLELDVATACRIVEEVARADGATGWNLMIALDGSSCSGRFSGKEGRAVYASSPELITAGALNPRGRLTPAEGGYRLSGRWPFGSGCQQADWFLVGGVVYAEGEPLHYPDGAPAVRHALVPAADVAIIDTWHVAGLRGTGSNDFAVEDVFVPEGRTVDVFRAAPFEEGALYAFPLYGLLAVSKAGVALGIARHAIEALVKLAAAKTPTGATALLRERPAVQADLARAEALVRSARALLYATIAEVWDTVAAGGQATLEQRARLRIAATHGAADAARAVDLMYNAGGATAIYDSSPLQRCFRDVHVLTAQIMVQSATLEPAGRTLLGLPPGTFVF